MQKINLKIQFALLLAIAVAPFAGISAAGLLDNNLYGNVNTGVNSNINGQVNVDANANANADARLTGSSTVTDDNDGSQVGVNSNVNTDEDSDIRIDRNSAEFKGSVNANGGASANVRMAPFNVMTRSDLRAFAAGELRGDENLTHLNFGSENIEVGYRQPGKLLGLIPVTLNVRAIVASDGKVLIHYPWYRFLVITEKADVQAAIDAEVSSYLSTTTPITFTPGIQAELAARIMAILEANLLDSSVNATSTGRGNAGF